MLLSLTLVRFGKFEEVASLGPRPTNDISAGMWDFARGYAALRRGDHNAAANTRDRLQQLAPRRGRVQDAPGEEAARNCGRDP